MSWVFLAGDTVHKPKKPARLPYVDFSSLEPRMARGAAAARACRDAGATQDEQVDLAALEIGRL